MTISTDEMKNYLIMDKLHGRYILIDPVNNDVKDIARENAEKLLGYFDSDMTQAATMNVYAFGWWNDRPEEDEE